MPMALAMAGWSILLFALSALAFTLTPYAVLIASVVIALLTVWLVNRLGHILEGIGGGDICGTGIVIAETLTVLALAIIAQLGPTLP